MAQSRQIRLVRDTVCLIANLNILLWQVQAPVRQSGAFKAYVEMWKESVAQPYKGVTIDGNIREGLHKLEDEGAPVQEATTAAQ